MAELNKNRIGLTLGLFGALLHAVWSLFVAIAPAGVQRFFDWLMSLHSLSMPVMVMPFRLLNSVLLIVVVFVLWYILGWVFAAVWNWVKV